MKILVTGFEPFDGESVNPALEAVKGLPERIGDAEIVKAEIPVVFGRAGEKLAEAVAACTPDIVLCIGQAGGASVMSVERIAVNLIDARIADNDGKQPVDVPVKEDGENAYFASVPVKAMVRAMQQGGVPAQLSFSAGSFVCNAVMYELLYLIDKKYPQMKGGFIHVPYTPQQAAAKQPNPASMHLEDMTKGLRLAIEAAVKGEELSEAMGNLQ